MQKLQDYITWCNVFFLCTWPGFICTYISHMACKRILLNLCMTLYRFIINTFFCACIICMCMCLCMHACGSELNVKELVVAEYIHNIYWARIGIMHSF